MLRVDRELVAEVLDLLIQLLLGIQKALAIGNEAAAR